MRIVRRLVLLVPDVDTAKKIVGDLLVEIEELDKGDIGIVARPDIELDGLPEAGLSQRTDIRNAMLKGLALGSATGLLAGLAAATLPFGATIAGRALLLLATLSGATAGTILAGIVGVSVPSEEMQKYEEALKEGKLLLMVDLPDSEAKKAIEIILRHHLEAEIKEIEEIPPLIPGLGE